MKKQQLLSLQRRIKAFRGLLRNEMDTPVTGYDVFSGMHKTRMAFHFYFLNQLTEEFIKYGKKHEEDEKT